MKKAINIPANECLESIQQLLYVTADVDRSNNINEEAFDLGKKQN